MKRTSQYLLVLLAVLVVNGMSLAVTHSVSITNYSFQPGELMVNAGDTVRWTNNDSSSHTVTATGGEFDSGMLTNGQSFAHVFAGTGNFAYVCQYHSNMSGTIQVMGAGVLHDVSISDYQFQPSDLSVNPGDTVRWTNHDSAPHTVTATGGEFDSGMLTTGQTFVHVFSNAGSFAYVCQYHSNMSGVVNVGTSGGESAWIELDSPTTLPLNDVRFWDEDLGWAGGEQGVLRTTNGGETWTLVGTSNDVEAVYFISASEGWACGNDGMIVHSTNGGQSWSLQVSGAPDKLRDIWFADDQNGWSVGKDGILIHTTNGGADWNPQSSPAVDDLRGIYMLDAQHGWIAGSDGLILYTSNGGADWESQLSVPGGEEDEFEAVFASDETHAWTAGGQGRIYMTSNGQSWNSQTSGTNVALLDVFMTSNENGWVCGTGGFLANTIDGGMMWHVQDPPEFAAFNSICFVNPELGFMVAGDGRIFRYSASPNAVSPHHDSALPTAARLEANYPNPFNPNTTIEFEMGASGPVSLEVFDVLGQRVATLINGPMSAGTHRTEFSGDNLPSGIYFYQLRAAENVQTRRMMLVK